MEWNPIRSWSARSTVSGRRSADRIRELKAKQNRHDGDGDLGSRWEKRLCVIAPSRRLLCVSLDNVPTERENLLALMSAQLALSSQPFCIRLMMNNVKESLRHKKRKKKIQEWHVKIRNKRTDLSSSHIKGNRFKSHPFFYEGEKSNLVSFHYFLSF